MGYNSYTLKKIISEDRIQKRVKEMASELSKKFTQLLHGDESLLSDSDLGDLRALAGVSKFPVRIKCALLGWNCLDELTEGEMLPTESPQK